jgi:hypothetical protein
MIALTVRGKRRIVCLWTTLYDRFKRHLPRQTLAGLDRHGLFLLNRMAYCLFFGTGQEGRL